MTAHLNRRGFLAASAVAGAGMMLGGRLHAAEPEFATTLHKSLIGLPSEATLKSWKAAGFEGMETSGQEAWGKSPAEAAKDRAMADKLGMRIHSVLFGWANFNDPAKCAGDVENVKTALRAAKGFGADAVLLVPCRIGGMAMPEPWEFDIEFDEKTGHIGKVVAGRQREVPGVHRRPQPGHRRHAQGRRATDSRGRGDRRRHRAGERVEQPLGQAGDLQEPGGVVRHAVGPGVLRHRQPRQVRAAGGVDSHAGQADRQVPRQGLQAQARRPRRRLRRHPRRQRQLAASSAANSTRSATAAG